MGALCAGRSRVVRLRMWWRTWCACPARWNRENRQARDSRRHGPSRRCVPRGHGRSPAHGACGAMYYQQGLKQRRSRGKVSRASTPFSPGAPQRHRRDHIRNPLEDNAEFSRARAFRLRVVVRSSGTIRRPDCLPRRGGLDEEAKSGDRWHRLGRTSAPTRRAFLQDSGHSLIGGKQEPRALPAERDGPSLRREAAGHAFLHSRAGAGIFT
jgi:hypothetical protein